MIGRHQSFTLLALLIAVGVWLFLAVSHSPRGVARLVLAARSGDTNSIVRLITNEGINVDARSGTRMTPLMVAASRGQVEAVAILLKLGADKTLLDPKGKTAAKYASEQGYSNIVLLIEGSKLE